MRHTFLKTQPTCSANVCIKFGRFPQVVVDLGKFNTEEEAAAAYDRASVWCLGLTSRLNFPAEQQIGAVGLLCTRLCLMLTLCPEDVRCPASDNSRSGRGRGILH